MMNAGPRTGVWGAMSDVMNRTLRRARIVAVAVIGTTAVVLGVIMLVLPGPGLLVIIGGLAILGSEFLWARRLMRKVKRAARSIKEGMQGSWTNGRKNGKAGSETGGRAGCNKSDSSGGEKGP